MLKKLSFWLGMVAVIAYSVGTSPTLLAGMTWLVGTGCVAFLAVIAGGVSRRQP